jgi:hypothetical protein
MLWRGAVDSCLMLIAMSVVGFAVISLPLASKDCSVDIWITEVVYAVKKQWICKLRFLFKYPRRQMLCLYYNLESNTRTHLCAIIM